jgi:hypothetical protein
MGSSPPCWAAEVSHLSRIQFRTLAYAAGLPDGMPPRRSITWVSLRRRGLIVRWAGGVDVTPKGAQELLPGWSVWIQGPGSSAWCAVPAPPGAELPRAQELPGRITAATSTELITLCRQRYAWHDICDTCGVPARQCGHRQPESDPRPW